MGKTKCDKCPNNTRTQKKGSVSILDCNQCDPGKHIDKTKNQCFDNICTCKNGIAEKGVNLVSPFYGAPLQEYAVIQLNKYDVIQ